MAWEMCGRGCVMSHTNRKTHVSRAKSNVVSAIRPIDVTDVPDRSKLSHNLVAYQGVYLTHVRDVLRCQGIGFHGSASRRIGDIACVQGVHMQNRALYSSLCSRGIIGLEMEGYHLSDLPLQDLTLDMEGDVHSYTDLVPGIVHLTSLCLQRLQDAHQKKSVLSH